ncbi:MAG: hypothetical protein KY434_08955 [Actinobacteria bacterium]|nr:hypothetical protein [Actinomycetota bacterium]
MSLITEPLTPDRRPLLTRRGFCVGLATALVAVCLPAATAVRGTLGQGRLGSGTLGDPVG